MKDFYRNYGATALIIVVLVSVFATGFIVGKYGKSGATAEAWDLQQIKAESETSSEASSVAPNVTSSVAEVETVSTTSEEETKPAYTEIKVTATAYCPCAKCCGKADGITATGTKATAGRTIAVDPSVIPYGTKVKINGNTYVAEDCGGAVKGNKIDIYFNTHEEALQFGRQKLTAYILN